MKNHKVRYKNNLSYDMVDFFKRKSVYIVVIRQPTEIKEMLYVYLVIFLVRTIVFVGTYTYTSKQLMGC